MKNAVTGVGLLLGSVMVGVASWVYLKEHSFGAGGGVLTTLGVVLVGLSIWQSVSVKVSAQGGIEAKFEQIRQDFRQVEESFKNTTQEVAQLRKEITSTLLSSQSPKVLGRLRQEELVSDLIHKGLYLEALRLDPTNPIAIMGHIEKSVSDGNFEEATKYFAPLQKANESGVGYSVYPQLCVAFEKQGQVENAMLVLRDLHRKIAKDLASGYGYLSRTRQLKWTGDELRRISVFIKEPELLSALDGLTAEIAKAVTDLKALQ